MRSSRKVLMVQQIRSTPVFDNDISPQVDKSTPFFIALISAGCLEINRDTRGGKLDCWPKTPKISGPALKQYFPEIERVSRINMDEDLLFSAGGKKLNGTGTMVDPGLLSKQHW